MTLTAPNTGFALVQARMAALSARFDGPGSTSAATDGSSGGAFGSVLADAIGDGTAAAHTVTGQDVVDDAMQYLGVPYKWGGTDPETGLDCSGFVQQAYEDLGINLPRVSRDQATVGTKVDSIDDAKPGDLVAFGTPVNHIGIYVGDNKMVVAPHTGDVVKVQEITRPIVAIRRVIPDGGLQVAGTVDLTSSGSSSALSSRAALAARLAGVQTSLSALGGTDSSSSELSDATPYKDLFEAAGAKYGISPRLLAAVAKVESNFRADVKSSAGAVGLMQFMPGTARGLGIDPTDPAQAIDGAARYLVSQQNRFGSVDLALAAYNAGGGAVARYGGIPPYRETQNYVQKVMALMNGATL